LDRLISNVEYDYKEWTPMALKIHANAADNPSWEEAMNGPNQSGYWKAMKSKLSTVEHNKDSWDVVDKEDWMNVLPRNVLQMDPFASSRLDFVYVGIAKKRESINSPHLHLLCHGTQFA
jgi:hypothetical protein